MNLPDELVGRWIVDQSGNVVADEIEQQIQTIVRVHFTRLGERDCGWAILYRDPSDDAYWELTFLQSELHGGGPSKLTRMTAEQISQLYPALKLF